MSEQGRRVSPWKLDGTANKVGWGFDPKYGVHSARRSSFEDAVRGCGGFRFHTRFWIASRSAEVRLDSVGTGC